MANTVKMKRSAVPGKVPATTDLDLGEIAINTYDGKAYIKKNVSGTESIVPLGGAGSGDVTGPNSSTDNAIARFDGVSGKIIQNSGASVDDSGNLTATTSAASGTGANKMPVGTTAQRPASPTAGMYRMNSTTGEPEWWHVGLSSWIPFADKPAYDVEVLIVAGGGGAAGGYSNGNGTGGGGAGGYRLVSATSVLTNNSYAVSVGGGGAGGTGTSSSAGINLANNGSQSAFGVSLTAVGGGAGGEVVFQPTGNNGGSGGGGGGSGSGGSGTSGQGNAGGAAYGAGFPFRGGGGGGAGSAGVNGITSGNGGTPLTFNSVAYAGGGGGGAYQGYSGGSGGGAGAGSGGSGSDSGGSASANTGSGGGGGGWPSTGTGGNGGNGGSGIVILRYIGAQRGSGGTVTSSGGYTYHTFTTSGTYIA